METAALVAELKSWEQDFKAIHGRKPELKDTPEPILAKYRALLALKKQKAKSLLQNREPVVLPKCGPSTAAAVGTTTPADELMRRAKARRMEEEEEGEGAVHFNVSSSSSSHSTTSSNKPRLDHLKKIKLDPSATAAEAAVVDRPVSMAEYVADKKHQQQQQQQAVVASAALPPPPPPPSSSSSTSFFPASSSKSEPNFVRLNLKHDWKVTKQRKTKKTKTTSSSKYSDSSDSHHPQQQQQRATQADVVATVLDLLEENGDSTSPPPTAPLPMCGHNLPCEEFTVKKKLANRGRLFYGCSLGWQARCGFFQWKDDTDQAARAAFRQQQQQEQIATAALPPGFALMSTSELKHVLHKRLQLPKLPAAASNKAALQLAVHEGWAMRQQQAHELLLHASPPPAAIDVLRKVFFHQDFLPHQRQAIDRLLVHKRNTLLVSHTGSGKSLVYQLPCLLLPHVTLVISPLVSLMQDQLAQLPPGVEGGVLHGTQAQQASVLARVVQGKCKLLYVSPERVFTQSFQTMARTGKLVCSLVCVDEAHCMTSWAHNFRPCYLRLGEALPRLFPGALVLALTATATVAVRKEISQSLGIDWEEEEEEEEETATSSWERDNLEIAVEQIAGGGSGTGKRFARLVELLGEDKDTAKDKHAGTIVYASTKYETDTLAERLQQQLEGGTSLVAPYHAGLEPKQRKRTQERFLNNKLRTVVATVAFGMGLNKPNVRSVIHYGMPRSVEEYAQEMGRAGRDGQHAQCTLFYDVDEAQRLLALSKSDGLEPSQLMVLMHALSTEKTDAEGVRAVFCRETSQSMDCKESTVETLLVFLSQVEVEEEAADGKGNARYLDLLSNGYGRVSVQLGGGARRTVNCPTLVHALTHLGRGQEHFTVDLLALVSEVRRSNDATTLSLANLIRQLHVAKDDGFLAKVELQDPCWFVRVNGSSTTTQDDASLVHRMHAYCVELERKAGESVQFMYSVCEVGRTQGAVEMKAAISRYLEDSSTASSSSSMVRIPTKLVDDVAKRAIAGDCRSLLADSAFKAQHPALQTSRAVARILHSIASTAFTFDTWSKHRLWGRYKDYDFEDLKLCVASLKI